ncbi:MAG: NUDIX hydrolase [Elusimicrobia bacterium]|nr:NUDIX hydrolase [Elusimicrobiota bacterium]
MVEKIVRNQFTYRGSAVGFKRDEVLLPNRRKAYREYLTHPGAVAILPFLDSPSKVPLERCRVVLVSQYRYPVNKITEELPAGKVDPKESLSSCLNRELKEETGYSTGKFRHMISYWPTPAFSQEKIHIYWADTLKKGISSPDEDEFIHTKIRTFSEVMMKVRKGEIRDSKTVIGILAFALFYSKTSSF